MKPLHPTASGVAACILEGMSNKETARAMGRCIDNIERHVAALCRRYQARNRVQLAIALYRETLMHT